MEKLVQCFKNLKKAQMVLAIAGAVCVCAVAVFGVLLAVNKNYIEFSVADKSTVSIEYGSGEEVPPVTAVYRGTIFNQKGIKVEVSVEGQV